MKSLNKVESFLFPDSQAITEKTIQHYENNPDELDLIINKEHFYSLYLKLIFVLGISITVIARLTDHFYGNVLGDFISNIILDVISELGIAIFGGSVVAYLIEFLNKKQFQQNIHFRREVKALIEKRKNTQNE